jgi:hypothetical protein
MTASYRRGRSSQAAVEPPDVVEKSRSSTAQPGFNPPPTVLLLQCRSALIHAPSISLSLSLVSFDSRRMLRNSTFPTAESAMTSTRAKSPPQSPPVVPARTTSRLSQEARPPTPPPKSHQSDGVRVSPASPGSKPSERAGRPSIDASKYSQLDAVPDNDGDDDDSNSTVSIDAQHSPLPPLPVFRGNGSPNHDVRTRAARGDGDADSSPKPRPAPSTIRESRVIDLPVQEKPAPEMRNASNGKADAAFSSNDTHTPNPPIFIPKIPPVSPTVPAPENLSTLVAGLEGSFVDEFGNVLDWHGHVLGRVAGDLPSMVGRPVASTGEVLNEDGQVVGYVVENETLEKLEEPKPLEGVAGPGLRVDHSGNILDGNGSVVGHMKNNNDPSAESAPKPSSSSTRPRPPPPEDKKETCACGQAKPSAAPSPSEIYLDVKSTNDGIQLIIKIPTIFNRNPPVVQIVNT